MNKYIILGCLLSVFIPPASAATLLVTIDNIGLEKGFLHIGLFTEQDVFPEVSDDLRVTIVDPTKKTLTIKFEDLKIASPYAVAVFQDANDSNVLEKNFFGAPKEPYGFSQKNPRFRAPSFNEAAVILIDDTTKIQIILR